MSKSASGSIRKKTVLRNGKQYTYWEARYTAGYDPSTGKQIQRSVSGKTQKEVRQKLTESQSQIDNGTYMEPSKITLGQWLEIWQHDFLVKQKQRTKEQYESTIRVHLIPALGGIRLDKLTTVQIQKFYSELNLSPKTIYNIHGVLHKALHQAVEACVIPKNPADGCELPKRIKPEIHPLEPWQMSAFLTACQGDRFEAIFKVALLTGMREGELIGLPWRNVNFKKGTITISQQIQRIKKEDRIVTPKHDRCRTLTVAPVVMDILKSVKIQQSELADLIGNPMGLCFTDDAGRAVSSRTMTQHFKKLLKEAELPEIRFHDLRHTYAVNALMAGDDIKTVQHNLGHATAAFTLDIYAHYTQAMRYDSADRMQKFYDSLSHKGKIRENLKSDGSYILPFLNKKAE